MKYIISITNGSEVIFKQEFENAYPLIARRQAIRLMRQILEGVKSEQVLSLTKLLLQSFPFLNTDEIADKAKDILLKQYCYTVCLDVKGFDPLIIIESSNLDQQHLDEWRAIEYSLYEKQGLNAGGEPAQVFLPRLNCDAPVLRDNLKNNIGFSQLLQA